MERSEILRAIDDEKLHTWLRSVRLPVLVEPGFFEDMGFPNWFVRKYLRKQRKVLLLDGTVQRGVHGVSEVDFVCGLAEEIGADTSAASRALLEWDRTRMCAEACIKVLDQIEGEEQATAQDSKEPVESNDVTVKSRSD